MPEAGGCPSSGGESCTAPTDRRGPVLMCVALHPDDPHLQKRQSVVFRASIPKAFLPEKVTYPLLLCNVRWPPCKSWQGQDQRIPFRKCTDVCLQNAAKIEHCGTVCPHPTGNAHLTRGMHPCPACSADQVPSLHWPALVPSLLLPAWPQSSPPDSP